MLRILFISTLRYLQMLTSVPLNYSGHQRRVISHITQNRLPQRSKGANSNPKSICREIIKWDNDLSYVGLVAIVTKKVKYGKGKRNDGVSDC